MKFAPYENNGFPLTRCSVATTTTIVMAINRCILMYTDGLSVGGRERSAMMEEKRITVIINWEEDLEE